MNIQEIIVAFVVLISFMLIARRIVHYFKRIKQGKSACEGCSCSCGCSGNPTSCNRSNEEKARF